MLFDYNLIFHIIDHEHTIYKSLISYIQNNKNNLQEYNDNYTLISILIHILQHDKDLVHMDLSNFVNEYLN